MVCDDLHRGRCQFLVCFRHCSSLPSHRLQKPKSERERELPMGKQYRIISVWLWSGDFNTETTVSLSENDQKSFLASMNDQEGCEDLFKFSFKDWELNNPGYRLLCVCVCVCVCVFMLSRVWLFAAPLDYTLPDYTPPSSSVHEISQATILVAISYSRGSSRTRDWAWVSWIDRQILYPWATREAHYRLKGQ